MALTRREVFEYLAESSSATPRETTTVGSLASALNTDRRTVESHLDALEACNLVHNRSNGRVRVTITGEELLEIDPAEIVVIDACEDRDQ